MPGHSSTKNRVECMECLGMGLDRVAGRPMSLPKNPRVAPSPLNEHSALASGAVGSPRASGMCSPHAEGEAQKSCDSRSTTHKRARASALNVRARTESSNTFTQVSRSYSMKPA